jgi:hypothetical protein
MPILLAAATTLAACHSTPPEPAPSHASSQPAAPSVPSAMGAPKNASRPMPARLVALGDLHGDLDATRRALRLAGAIDEKDAWIGGKLVVVQTGDEVDRGDGDRAIVDLFDRLKAEAAKAGGEVIALVGNHEIMNASLDFRYVTKGGFSSFGEPKTPGGVDRPMPGVEPAAVPRAEAFAPGGAYAKILAKRPVVARVGDTIFAHGGILPKHVATGLDAINDQARAWLEGNAKEMPRALASEDGPLWTRAYSAAPGPEECRTLTDTLAALGAKRMVVGHTVQRNGANAACDGKVWRIDVGMSKFYGGPVQVLQIEGDAVKVLEEAK